MINDTVISFDIIAISLSDLRNYFDSPTKLFSDLYLVKFLNTSTKHFFCVAFLFLFFFFLSGIYNQTCNCTMYN